MSCQRNSDKSQIIAPLPAVEKSKSTKEDSKIKSDYKAYLSDRISYQFDYPIGNKDGEGSYVDLQTNKTHHGWYIATETAENYSVGIHTGEDWNGNGGSNTDLGQPVYTISSGLVIHAKNHSAPWGNTVIIEHVFIQNGHLDTIFSLYAHLDEIKIKEGEYINNRQLIGTIGDAHGAHLAHLHLEIRKKTLRNYSPTYWPSSHGKDTDWVRQHYYDPSTFIDNNRTIEKVSELDHLLIAYKSEFKMHHLEKGKLIKTYEIALSQVPVGDKNKEGDLKLPEGGYSIIQKSRGPFEGSYGDFFGKGWMRLNYPNNFDATEAYKQKLISKTQLKKIKKANAEGSEPLRNTGLGAGIGIHGWSGDWDVNGHRAITWGCISMLNSDLDQLYDLLPLGTPIYINP